MISFSKCSYRTQVARLRRLAHNALRHYAFEVASVKLIAHWNNTTFDVRDTNGNRYVLRIGRPHFQDLAHVDSECEWLALIHQETDLCVPEMVLNTAGEYVVVVGAEGVCEDRVCVLFNRRPGFFYEKGLLPKHYKKAGQLLGELHLFAQSVEAPRHFVRKKWTVETALGCVSGVDQQAFKVLLRPGDDAIYEAVWEQYVAMWHILGHQADEYGMIHGDFHPRNILFMIDRVGVIDFDECGWGHYLHDVAVAMMGIRKLKRYDQLRDAFLEGYGLVRPLPEVLDGALNAFMAGRLLGLAVWTAGVTDHPWNREQAPQVVAETMDELGAMIKRK